jgi:hypothetical protein
MQSDIWWLMTQHDHKLVSGNWFDPDTKRHHILYVDGCTTSLTPEERQGLLDGALKTANWKRRAKKVKQ